MTRLLLVTGSTRRKSTNTAALHTASELLGEEGAIVYDALAQLPAFNPDDDHESLPPQDAVGDDGLIGDGATRDRLAKALAQILAEVQARS